LVQPLNFLCLDEPTNHLDIMSRDVLEDALVEYGGALVLITHDRHLIRSVANRIVEVVHGEVTEYAGDYDFYLSRRAPRDEEKLPMPQETRTSRKDQRRVEAEARARLSDLRKQIVRIEKELDAAAAEVARISQTLADPEVYSTDADVMSLVKDYERAKKRTARLEQAWEAATERLEAAQSAG
jgi:ATP-binding cassette subfamily F protein 3